MSTVNVHSRYLTVGMIQDTLELSIILNAIFTSAGCLASGAKIGYMAQFFDPYAKTTSLVILLIFLR